MALVLHQDDEALVVPIPSTPTHQVCIACGATKRKVRQRKNMPAPVIAPNPYDVPVQLDHATKALLDQGKKQVAKAKVKARRQEFAERVATWSPARIKEELGKIDEAVQAHEQKIAECLRQRMILEDQLAACGSDEDFAACLASQPEPKLKPEAKPEPPACPF
jgi:hypothetical protein